jgi:hypothetical protein
MGIFRILLAAIFLGLVGYPGFAVAACYGPDRQLPATTVSDFLNNPSSLLQQAGNANGGPGMISLIRDLVSSNSAALPAVLGLLAGANVDQQQAIGSGLGQAALLCVRPDPTFAAEIQAQVADPKYAAYGSFKTAYAAATGNVLIGSVGGGAGGGGVSGGSSGGQTNPISGLSSGSSAFQAFTSSSFTNPSTNYFTGSVSGISAGSTTTTTNTSTISAAKSVSP